MKIIAVTRIRNEDDIVEAFARHHAALVDHHVFLENASTDRTLEILVALREEGKKLTVHTSSAATNAEAVQNTLLSRRAVSLGGDWVIHLDCDEFLDPRPLGGSLRQILSTVPDHAPCAQTRAVNYHPTADDDLTELVVPRRQHWHDPKPADFVKVFVRSRAIALGATMGAGNHEAFLRGTQLPAYPDPRLLLAHYYMRSGWQIIAKACTGMIKTLAAGQQAIQQNIGTHYTHIFENMRDHPEWLLEDVEFLRGTRPASFYGADIVSDPIEYLGGNLRYTASNDPRLNATRSIIACAEAVARRHGQLADATEATQRQVDQWAAEFLELP